jgi:hypothetical protein
MTLWNFNGPFGMFCGYLVFPPILVHCICENLAALPPKAFRNETRLPALRPPTSEVPERTWGKNFIYFIYIISFIFNGK